MQPAPPSGLAEEDLPLHKDRGVSARTTGNSSEARHSEIVIGAEQCGKRHRPGRKDKDALKRENPGLDTDLRPVECSFEAPLEVLERDLRGHIFLLEEM